MKMADALKTINRTDNGFVVMFEWAENGLLRNDYFPDVRSGEEPIPTEEEAWRLAYAFAKKTGGKCIYIFVASATDFSPVYQYREKMIVNR